MFVQFVVMLSMVSVSLSTLYGSKFNVDHLPLVREATSRIVSRFAESAKNVHVRQQGMPPAAVASFMINMSDADGDRQLDADEIKSFYQDMVGLDSDMAEMMAGAFLAEGDTSRDGKLSSGELTNILAKYGGSF
ncbi:hypothetical protein ScPMuIL_003087 [Solemya velum]